MPTVHGLLDVLDEVSSTNVMQLGATWKCWRTTPLTSACPQSEPACPAVCHAGRNACGRNPLAQLCCAWLPCGFERLPSWRGTILIGGATPISCAMRLTVVCFHPVRTDLLRLENVMRRHVLHDNEQPAQHAFRCTGAINEASNRAHSRNAGCAQVAVACQRRPLSFWSPRMQAAGSSHIRFVTRGHVTQDADRLHPAVPRHTAAALPCRSAASMQLSFSLVHASSPEP